MLKRIITAVALLAFLIPVLIFADTFVLPVAVSLFSVVAAFEILKCVGLHKNIIMSIPVYILAFVCPIATRYIDDYTDFNLMRAAFAVVIIMLLFTFCMMVTCHKKDNMPSFFVAYGLFLYSAFGHSSVIYMYDMENGGKYFYLLIFIGAFVTDTFAYFTGFFFGKHKLIPEVSPKKTIEGSIGGIVFCVIAFVVFGIVYNNFFSAENGQVSLIFLAVVGFITSIVAQIGDLSLSAVKRHWNIKDYGNIFPGHGGVLDRLDAMLAVSLFLSIAFSFV